MWRFESQVGAICETGSGDWYEAYREACYAARALPFPEHPTVQLLLKDATENNPWSCVGANCSIRIWWEDEPMAEVDMRAEAAEWVKDHAGLVSEEIVDHGDREHSDLGASSCERWWNCAGSLNLTRKLNPPPRTSPDAERGTAAHEVGHMCLLNGQDAIEMIDRVVNNVLVDEKIAYGVQMYLDLCRGFKAAGYDHLFIEKKFNLRDLNPPKPMFGTADFALVKGNTLIVVDYKNGFLYVDPSSPQLRYYVLGVICALPRDAKIERIEVFIVQPNGEGSRVKKAQYTVAEIFEWHLDLMRHAKATQDPNAPLNAGSWCKFCPNGGLCHKEAEARMEDAQLQFSADVPPGSPAVVEWTPIEINGLTPDQVGALLLKVPLVENFIASLQAVAKVLIENGTDIPHWKLVPGLGHRKWIAPNSTANKLTGSYGLEDDQIWEKKLASPATVEKLLRPKLRELGVKGKRADEMLEQALTPLTTRPTTAPRLVRDTDPTPALPARGEEFTAEYPPDKT